MVRRKIVIIGSGIAGTTVAYLMTQKGHEVDIFEKGPDYPYPHIAPFQEKVLYGYDTPAYALLPDLKGHIVSGDYKHRIEKERIMLVGGGATRWEGITLRMKPQDFKVRSLYKFGVDWPLTYGELEPYYCKAEAFLGVAGTDADNPYASPRSKPYPLPPFPLSYDDQLLAAKLRKQNIILHTTPQARTSLPYEGRPACDNYRTCNYCPIGARYSPNYHLIQALETGLCKINTNSSVRRIIFDKSGKAKGIVYQQNDSDKEKEHSGDIIILAAGAIESVRLLLLSVCESHPEGPGNKGGNVGKYFLLNHVWRGWLFYNESLYPGRFGGWTGQSHQFCDPPTRGKHGGIKVEFSTQSYPPNPETVANWQSTSGTEIVKKMDDMLHKREIDMQAESIPTPEKYIKLSGKKDRFGDPFAHVHYESSEFDRETFKFARNLLDRFVSATNPYETLFAEDPNKFDSGAHHLGGCRMGNDERDSVVTSFGQIHTIPNLFVLGSSIFPGTPGAMNPTLTVEALTIRTAEFILDQLL